jgi:N-acetyl-gamma-glutamyl-phosphate reductase
VIKTSNIIVDSKSGYSGAGKTKDKEQLLKEVYENIKTYGVGDHKHIAEINQELTLFNEGEDVEIFFSANLIPVERGILSNIYINPIGVSAEEIHQILFNKFQDESFINILPLNEIPNTKEVVGTNNLIIGVKKGYKDDTICIVSVLDNLVKGAAGQAMQNFNLMNKIDEETTLI